MNFYIFTIFFMEFTQATQVLIMYNSLIHSYFEPITLKGVPCTSNSTNCYGGAGRMLHLIRQSKSDVANDPNANVIYINGGNTFTGTPWFYIHHEKIVYEVMNLLEPDAMILGTSEIQSGLNMLERFVENYKYPILAANFEVKSNDVLAKRITASTEIVLKGGVRLGIIGFTALHSDILKKTGHIIIRDEVASVLREAEILHRKGIKLIIAVGHASAGINKKVGQDVHLLDAIIGCKRHAESGSYPEFIKQISGNKIPFVFPKKSKAIEMSYLWLSFDENGEIKETDAYEIPLDSDVPIDPAVTSVLDKYRKEVSEVVESVVAATIVQLSNQECTYKECMLGNFITDAYVKYYMNQYKGKYWSDASIAVINAGAIKTSFDVGQITMGHIYTSLPFGDGVVSYELTGADIYELFEASVLQNDLAGSQFLQVSGIRVVYNMLHANGDRVISIMVLCTECDVPEFIPIKSVQKYRIISSTYIQQGGDGFNGITDHGKNVRHIGSDVNIVQWYLQKKKNVYAEITDRITILKSIATKIFSNNLYITIFFTLLCGGVL